MISPPPGTHTHTRLSKHIPLPASNTPRFNFLCSPWPCLAFLCSAYPVCVSDEMGLLCVPKASRQMQRTLKNLRVSLFCFLLTFLMLRNTIGAGKFGTPAQDFEEIRQHLHNVGLHRKHVRMLAEAVEEEKQRGAPLLKLEGKHRGEGREGEQERTPWLEEEVKQGNAALIAVALTHRDAPSLTDKPLEGSLKEGVLKGNVGLQKDLEGSRMTIWDVQRKLKEENAGFQKDPEGSVQREIREGNVGFQKDLEASRSTIWGVQRKIEEGNAGFQNDLEGSRMKMQRKMEEALAQSSYGGNRVLLMTEVPYSGCKNPAGENFLLKSLKNKVDYSTRHGLEISLSFGALDPLSNFSLLRRSMLKYRHVEWLWWVPSAALITDMAHELPLQDYAEFNLVLLGLHDPTRRGRSSINPNTDTFFIRNCQWSLDLLRKCSKMVSAGSRRRDDATDRLLTNPLMKRPHYDAGELSPLIFFSDGEEKFFADKESSVVLSGDWRGVAPKLESMVKESERGNGDRRLPFVTHFLGCKLCYEAGDKEGGLCMRQMERAVHFAEKQVMKNDGLASSEASIF